MASYGIRPSDEGRCNGHLGEDEGSVAAKGRKGAAEQEHRLAKTAKDAETRAAGQGAHVRERIAKAGKRTTDKLRRS